MNSDPRKCFLALLALAALLVAPRWACAADGEYTHGLLWKVSRPGGRPNYLFGTIHTDDPRVTHPPPEVERAFD
ncbi:MAG: TraB/GumN family protein, partial [Pseudonocardiaceae bacterium]